MLAFAKDITLKKPTHPDEDKNPELKTYMNYQRKINNPQLVYHSLKQAKNKLQENLQAKRKNQNVPENFLEENFSLSHRFADAPTLLTMLKKLINGQNATQYWYRMNAYYTTLVFDCMKSFIETYNHMIQDSSEDTKEYTVTDGVEVDFADWAYLFFQDLDFHIGKNLGYSHYPFAKRNKAIEEDVEKAIQKGETREKALKNLKEKYEIDNISIKVLLDKQITYEDLELFYTPVKNHIYESLSHKQEGSWGSLDGETPMDQAYNLGSQMKIWVWTPRKKAKKEE
ncbi:MAG: hypothetical protein GWM98_20305 [Nitrospinaceae bacterium]|nr:hypothetical protein [Nitrospinaceae bacterium]